MRAGTGLRRARRWSRRFRGSERGVTVIEFAMVLPVMIILFIGLVEFSEAFTISRKLATAATTVSDLVAQETSISCADLDKIKLAADEIVKPYGPMNLVIVSVVADAENNTSVAWSRPAGTATYTLPETGLTDANSSLIVAEASYNFTPTIGHFLGTFPITGRAFFRPRMSSSVTKTGC